MHMHTFMSINIRENKATVLYMYMNMDMSVLL
uniref:Uncharacterized protein n=1 Tax=Amphimedon queenslandica TaxID=400682 RepID=A0A1X7UZV6_AMPQE